MERYWVVPAPINTFGESFVLFVCLFVCFLVGGVDCVPFLHPKWDNSLLSSCSSRVAHLSENVVSTNIFSLCRGGGEGRRERDDGGKGEEERRGRERKGKEGGKKGREKRGRGIIHCLSSFTLRVVLWTIITIVMQLQWTVHLYTTRAPERLAAVSHQIHSGTSLIQTSSRPKGVL